MVQFLERLIGVFLLREPTFEAIGQNEELNWQAAIVVFFVALFGAISSAVTAAILGLSAVALNTALSLTESATDWPLFRVPASNPISVFVTNFSGSFVSWALWALMTYLIGVYVFKGKTSFGEMLRIIGFAQAPRLLSLLGILPIPFFGLLMALVGWVWAIVATFIGVRQGLEVDNGKAILTIVLSLIAIFLTHRFVIAPLVTAIF